MFSSVTPSVDACACWWPPIYLADCQCTEFTCSGELSCSAGLYSRAVLEGFSHAVSQLVLFLSSASFCVTFFSPSPVGRYLYNSATQTHTKGLL